MMKSKSELLHFYNRGDELFGSIIADVAGRLRSGETTRLCEIMKRHGSDKGLGWHNYTVLYDSLFSTHMPSINIMLEVGIGTNNLDVPSNMGENGIPGASLRGWREYFSNAVICGGDVDVRILFEEERIRTYKIDQLSRKNIRSLIDVIPHIWFDIILDDGLHTFEANRNLLRGLMHRLRPGGLYIIEDILLDEDNRLKFHEFFKTLEEPGFFYQLPSDVNMMDNAVAVFIKL